MNVQRRPAGYPGTRVSVLVLLTALGFGALPSRSSTPPPTRHRPGFPILGMVPLVGDQLLLWNGDGRAQLRTTVGAWTEVFRLPVQAIQDVQPDGEGMLVVGSPKPGSTAVLLLAPHGEERGRWNLSDDVFRLIVDERGRRAVTRSGTVPLLAGGKLGSPEPSPGGVVPAGRLPPIVLTRNGVTVTCQPADLSMEHRSRASCERKGPGGWRFESDFLDSPLVCSGWLLTLDGPRPWRVTVYSLASGKIGGRLSAPFRPAFACAGPNEILFGDKSLSLRTLPGGKSWWVHATAGKAVARVALLNSFLAYQIDGSADVFLLPRPSAGAR
jgi:hypothetical protein